MACGILVPRPGIEPALEIQSLNYWTTREVPVIVVFKCSNFKEKRILLYVVFTQFWVGKFVGEKY